MFLKVHEIGWGPYTLLGICRNPVAFWFLNNDTGMYYITEGQWRVSRLNNKEPQAYKSHGYPCWLLDGQPVGGANQYWLNWLPSEGYSIVQHRLGGGGFEYQHPGTGIYYGDWWWSKGGTDPVGVYIPRGSRNSPGMGNFTVTDTGFSVAYWYSSTRLGLYTSHITGGAPRCVGWLRYKGVYTVSGEEAAQADIYLTRTGDTSWVFKTTAGDLFLWKAGAVWYLTKTKGTAYPADGYWVNATGDIEAEYSRVYSGEDDPLPGSWDISFEDCVEENEVRSVPMLMSDIGKWL